MDLNTFAAAFSEATIVELSQVCQKDIPVWPTHPHYLLQPWEEKRLGSVANDFILMMGEHNGTHIDASYHFYGKEEGGKSIEEYPAEKFCGPCVKLDFQGCGADFLVSRQSIQEWESKNGPICEDDIVLFDFGWSKLFAPLPEGESFLKKWPGIGKDAAEYLAEKKIRMIGVDTFAADIFGSTTHDTHHVLLSKDILIMECLNNLDQLPPRSFFIAQPLRLKGGSGSPMRPIALYWE